MDWKRLLGKTPEDRLNLSYAYTRVLRTGGASQDDREVVFNDIMNFSGYFRIDLEGNLKINEGKRSVGGLVFSMVNMGAEEREALFQATRQTAIEEQY